MPKLKGLSLFANVGIAETYLSSVGLDVVVANELLPERVKFYNHFYANSKMVGGDITNPDVYKSIIDAARAEKINFILATPPCQGMSVAGKMSETDPRNSLIIKAMDSFKDLMPDYMLIENVPQMLNTSILYHGGSVKIKDFITNIVSPTHDVKFDVFDAADYGTAQTRKRAFVRIYKRGLVWDDPVKQPKITVKDVIGNLPSIESGQKTQIANHCAKSHNANHILWMKHTPTGKTALDNAVHYPKKDGRKIKGFSTTYRRMAWDKPAPTVTMANGSISSQNNVHPGRLLPDGTYSDARVLTLLEIFRISGLPDSWGYPSWASENLVRHVIGEAIPPMMVKAIVAGIK